MRTSSIESKGQLRSIVHVAVGAALGLLLFELFFKWSVISSEVFILDDAFMFERAIHGRPFSDLGEFLPAFQAVDLDRSPGLKFYRFLAETAGDISKMRIIYLSFFAITCALFAMLIYRVTNDRNLSILIGVFACITPFSPVLILFTNGSYNIVYFGLLFAALLMGTFIGPDDRPRKKIWLVASITSLLLLSAVFVEVGFLLSLAVLVWLFFYSKTYASASDVALFSLSSALVVAQAIWILTSYTSHYEAMPDRVNYALGSMFVNGLSIIDRSMSSFWDPMLGTGQPTLRSSLTVAIAFILINIVLYGGAGFKLLRTRSDWEKLRGPLSFSFFLSVCAVLSIGPYTALKLSHLWHYFPHMLFLSSSVVLLIYLTLSKTSAYFVLAVSAVLTVLSYSQQISLYNDHVNQQKLFANFVKEESNSWGEQDQVILIFDGRVLGGLNSDFRSTGFTRYVTQSPDSPVVKIKRSVTTDRHDCNFESEPGQCHVYEMDKSGSVRPIS